MMVVLIVVIALGIAIAVAVAQHASNEADEKKLEGLSLLERGKARAKNWWSQRHGKSAICDLCSSGVPSNGGLVLLSKEVAQSGTYIEFLSERMAASMLGTRTTDRIVLASLLPVASLVHREKAIAEVNAHRTPWLVCDDCLVRHFR